ncbi:hypothetical protein SCYAM73S_06574 [Streptomyces cyaneofuscatus]
MQTAGRVLGEGDNHDHHRITKAASTAAPAPAPAPAATARELGLAHYAARGVLEYVLARHGATFAQQIALRAAINADAPQTPDELVAQVQGALKADPAGIRAVLDELLAKELSSPTVKASAHGGGARALRSRRRGDRPHLRPRLGPGHPAEDLAAAGRVLALVTERADAELAALTA